MWTPPLKRSPAGTFLYNRGRADVRAMSVSSGRISSAGDRPPHTKAMMTIAPTTTRAMPATNMEINVLPSGSRPLA